MRDAVKILFDCAMEVRIPSYLTGNEYKNCTLALRREEKHFLSLLPPEEALRLEEYFASLPIAGMSAANGNRVPRCCGGWRTCLEFPLII